MNTGTKPSACGVVTAHVQGAAVILHWEAAGDTEICIPIQTRGPGVAHRLCAALTRCNAPAGPSAAVLEALRLAQGVLASYRRGSRRDDVVLEALRLAQGVLVERLAELRGESYERALKSVDAVLEAEEDS